MIYEKVCEIISKQLDIEEGIIKPETRLIEDLKADSLDVVELVMDLEQEYNIEISDDDLPNVKTVQDIVDQIEKLK